MSSRTQPSAVGVREPEHGKQSSLTSSLLIFLDKNLKNFSPRVRDVIGLGILLLLVTYVLHGLVGPTYIRGQLWVVDDANGDAQVAPGWTIEYDNQDTTSNAHGYWTLPVRLGGIPERLRINLTSGPRDEFTGGQREPRYVDTVSVVGPWPIWSALRPMDYTIFIHLTKPLGQRIQVASGGMIGIANRSQTVFAQAPALQSRAADPRAGSHYSCEISIDAVKVNKFPGFLRSSGRAYFVMYLNDKRVDDDLLYNAVVASPDQHFPVESNNELWIPVDSKAERRYKGLSATLLPVADCSGITSGVTQIIPKGKLTLKMFADSGALIDNFDLGPVLGSPGKILLLNGNETGNATVSFHATAHSSTGPTINFELSSTAKEAGRKPGSPDMLNDRGLAALLIGHDPKKAMGLFRKAAAAGSKEGMHNLGVFYETGLEGPRDLQQARQWYEKAAALGDKDAQERLKQLPL